MAEVSHSAAGALEQDPAQSATGQRPVTAVQQTLLGTLNVVANHLDLARVLLGGGAVALLTRVLQEHIHHPRIQVLPGAHAATRGALGAGLMHL